MALAPNPPIYLTDLRTEFGDANGGNVCLTEYYAGGANVPAGTTGTNGAIPSSGTICLTDFPGSSNTSLNTWPTILPGPQTIPAPWGNASITNASFAQTFCNYAQQHDTSNSRLNHRWTTATSAAPSVFSYAYQNYTGLGSATFQAKAVYSVSSIGFVGTVENPQTGSPASNTWTNVSTSSYTPVWQWSITVNSGSGTRRLSGDVTFYMRALLGSTYYPNSTGYDSGTKYIELAATRGTNEPLFCLHYDMFVQLENNQFINVNTVEKGMSIKTASGYSTVTNVWIDHLREGYYNIDGLKITGDHPFKLNNEWITPEDYTGTKEYIEGEVPTVYIETESGEYLTFGDGKSWTVSGNYASE